jgi:hypothetical protein
MSRRLNPSWILTCLFTLALLLGGCEKTLPVQQSAVVDDEDASVEEGSSEDEWAWPEECEDELETADACWMAAETDADFDACMALEEALIECLDANDPGWDDDFQPPEECEDELAAADACWETAETDADYDVCMELEEALMECWDIEDPFPGDDDDCGDDDDYEFPEECIDELEAADACWGAAETEDDLDACMELEEALMECWDENIEEPVEPQ